VHGKRCCTGVARETFENRHDANMHVVSPLREGICESIINRFISSIDIILPLLFSTDMQQAAMALCMHASITGSSQCTAVAQLGVASHPLTEMLKRIPCTADEY
jgi:hypothetical protein